jgi:ribosome-associated protein
MPIPEIRRQVAVALEAVNSKKAEDVTLLQLPRESSTFTDYFLICSGHNPRQVQAIADEVDEQLSKGMGVEPNNREGYEAAEWILLDYVDFVVHIFNAQRRAYYDLERLWKSAHKLTSQDLAAPQKPPQPQRAGSSRAGRPTAAEAPPTRKPPAKPAAKKKFPGVRAAAKQSARGAANPSPVKRSGASKGGKKVAARKSTAGKAGAKKKSR